MPKHIPPIIQQLRSARLALSITHEQLAAKLGYALSTISYWENFRRSPQLVNLINWADVLGYEITIKPKGKSNV
jgi:transcriptional regulator with XRE-family HTH domain